MAPNTVVLTIEKPNNNFSLVEIGGPDTSMLLEQKQKAASPKQFTWLLLLKAHRALACVSWLAMSLNKTFASVKKRINSSADTAEEEPQGRGIRLYRFMKAFLFISIFAFAMEVIAHFKKWNYLPAIHPSEVQGLVHWSYMAWLAFRADYIAPLVIRLSQFCIVLFMIQSLDRMVLCLGCFWIKYRKLKPVIDEAACDIEDSLNFPMVLVQIPMCNEREVCKQTYMRFISGSV